MYYLFIIKDNYFYDTQEYLYELLYDLKTMHKENYSYGINMYYDLCKPFDVNVLKHYVKSKYDLESIDNKFYLDKYNYFEIKKSACVISNYKYLREILCIFYIYNRNIFVCNFNTNEHFFIKDKFK